MVSESGIEPRRRSARFKSAFRQSEIRNWTAPTLKAWHFEGFKPPVSSNFWHFYGTRLKTRCKFSKKNQKKTENLCSVLRLENFNVFSSPNFNVIPTCSWNFWHFYGTRLKTRCKLKKKNQKKTKKTDKLCSVLRLGKFQRFPTWKFHRNPTRRRPKGRCDFWGTSAGPNNRRAPIRCCDYWGASAGPHNRRAPIRCCDYWGTSAIGNN